MKSDLARKLTLYNYRYWIGYGTFFLILLILTCFAISSLPNGLSSSELGSATTSGQLNLRHLAPSDVVNLPYHVLQSFSIRLFGLTDFAIRLPSVILAFLSGGVMVLMLRRWSRDNIAIVAGLMSISSVLFLTIARSGSPMIMSIFLTLVALLAAAEIARGARRTLPWKIVAGIAVALLLYTPFGIYPVAAFAIAGVLHPKIRLVFLRRKPWRWLIGAAGGLLTMIPLGWAIWRQPEILTQLLGWGRTWQPGESFLGLGNALFGTHEKAFYGFLTPAISMVSMLIIITGLLKIGREWHSARSFLILPWLLIILPMVIYNPNALYMLFVPFALLTAVGTETIVREWYKLFPKNPYARATALVPLAVLIGGLVYATINRYYMSNTYFSAIVSEFSQEPTAVRRAVNDRSAQKINLVVTKDQLDFYRLLEREYPNLTVTTEPAGKPDSLIVAGTSSGISKQAPYRLVTSSRATDSLLLKIYEK